MWVGRAVEGTDRAAPISIRGLRVLLEDDLPKALNAISDRLTLMGRKVDARASGEAAMRQVESAFAVGKSYVVMLIDWKMNGMDGLATLRAIRRIMGAGAPPSILVTAYDERSAQEAAHAASFDAVLVKPITPSTLHDTLVRVLHRAGNIVPVTLAPPGDT